MIVTVCELPDDRPAFGDCWTQLVEHIKQAGGGTVVLPGMPFSRWFADATPVDAARWSEAVAQHDSWEHRLAELGAPLVLGSRPIDFGNERYDEGFAWDPEFGIRSIHARGTQEFMPLEVGGVSVGLLIGDEVWRDEVWGDEVWAEGEQPQPYTPGEVDFIAMPRCTRFAGLNQRLERARAVATATGAFVLSSNRGAPFEGQGWIIGPDGSTLGTTTPQQPFLTLEIALASERLLADCDRIGPAPAWMDPLETGMPDYDPPDVPR
jgi:N-carbamoylputrescine amidase